MSSTELMHCLINLGEDADEQLAVAMVAMLDPVCSAGATHVLFLRVPHPTAHTPVACFDTFLWTARTSFGRPLLSSPRGLPSWVNCRGHHW